MAETSFDSLARRLDRLAEGASKNVEKATRGAAIIADQVLVLGTPVDTGRARAAWQVSFGSPNLSIPPIGSKKRIGPKDSGAAAGLANAKLEENRRKILTFRVGGDLFLSNAVPYIARLDMGSSQQAPLGFSREAADAARQHIRKFKFLPRGRAT
jgi:hypothetical protein